MGAWFGSPRVEPSVSRRGAQSRARRRIPVIGGALARVGCWSRSVPVRAGQCRRTAVELLARGWFPTVPWLLTLFHCPGCPGQSRWLSTFRAPPASLGVLAPPLLFLAPPSLPWLGPSFWVLAPPSLVRGVEEPATKVVTSRWLGSRLGSGLGLARKVLLTLTLLLAGSLAGSLARQLVGGAV
jgi:hypothetical protein